MSHPDPQEPSASSDDTSLPRIALDSLEDFQHISSRITSTFDQFDPEERRQVLGPLISLLKDQFPDKEVDPDLLFSDMKQTTLERWVEPVLSHIKANVTVGGQLFDECTDLEPVSMELDERLRKIQAQRDESLRQVMAMRTTHPENYETMMHDFVRLVRKMNIEGAAQEVEVTSLNPAGPPWKDVNKQGLRDLEEALETAADGLKPVK